MAVLPPTSRRRVASALSEFRIPYPLTIDTLYQAIQEQRDRPLILHRSPFPSRLEQPCGLWWPDEEGRDNVWVNPIAVGVQAVQSLAHELGHMLLEHPPLKVRPPAAEMTPPPEPEEEESGFKWLSPAFLEGSLLGVRTRSRVSRRDPTYVLHEEEAENFAGLLRRQAMVQSRDEKHGDPMLNRLYRSL
ncbi:hypothetical protein [Streptomyces sp. WM6378]|uniref:hypothetical protein n=1 Tax=Streptomyces sp. WM6378 TaxID=1415557 RepID=UPI0006AFA0B0|nr:hypothetical protein [Streptomyces sp. WM6378]KOU50086.1 hypothetical protein ADK54_09975 [Streptomyces sp. WM6378]